MKHFWTLFKLQLKNRFRSNLQSGKKMSSTAIMALSMLPLLGILCYTVFMLATAAVAQGILTEILVLLMLSAQLFTLFFASKVYINIFYNAEDNEFLTSLPAAPAEMFLSKFLVVYLTELSFSAYILIPTLVTVAVAAGYAGHALPAVYYVFIPLAVLFAPVIPLLAISILAAPIMYLSSFFKRRAAMSSVVGILLFVVLMGGYFALIPNFSNISQLQSGLPEQAVAVFRRISQIVYFDKVYFLAALNIEFAKNFFICLGIVLGAFAVCVAFTLLFFKRAVSAQFETHTKNKTANLQYKSQSVVRSLLQNDFKSLIRMPGFALNSFLNIFMAPLFMLAMFFIGNGMTGGEADASVMDSETILTGMLMMYTFMFNFGMNYVATLSFTREGKSFYFLKHLPVSCAEVLKAKRAFADIDSAIGILLIALCALLLFKLNAVSVVAFCVISYLFATGFNMLGIYRDMKKPNFEWTTVEEAIKRNYYIMLPFLIAFGMGFAAILLAAGAEGLVGFIGIYWSLAIFWAVMFAAALAFTLLCRKKLYKDAEALFEAMCEPKIFARPTAKVKLPNLRAGL